MHVLQFEKKVSDETVEKVEKTTRFVPKKSKETYET